MTRITLASPPTITKDSIGVSYTIDRGEKGPEIVTLTGRRVDPTSYLPAKKVDALAFATIVDAVSAFIGQQESAALAGFRLKIAAHKKAVNEALRFVPNSDKNGSATLLRLMRNPPVKPDLSDELIALLAPYQRFVALVRLEWSGARKHVLAVRAGNGPRKGQVTWTGTLSSLVGKTPARGMIAVGRRIF